MMHDKDGNKYDYKPNSCGCVIYKNDEFYMQVATEEDAKELIKELCEEG